MAKVNDSHSLDIHSLLDRYRTGSIAPADAIAQVYDRIDRYADPAVWIYLAPIAETLERAKALQNRDPQQLPLYGIPFAIKDNLDWAGVPTTAGCPQFARTPARSSAVVERLCAAGAIAIGKTNMDQFATGLVGTRTPYGVCRNPFDRRYIPGGSSSGSAAAVSAGLVSFALGSDTAGSGRVPAAFTNIVGLKPTCGSISTRGLLPAVRSLDCVSVFALTCADAASVLQVASGFDAEDAFARRPETNKVLPDLASLRVGVPPDGELEFFGNAEAEQLYREAIARLQSLGCTIAPIDFKPFADAAEMLYGGPIVAERLAAIGDFLEAHPEAIDPIVYQIISSGKRYDTVSAYRASYQLAELSRRAEIQWQSMDVLAVPTTGTIYTVGEVAAAPIALNTTLGRYTNFANLLDLCAIAVPSGFQSNGLPAGLTLMAPAWHDLSLCRLGSAFHASLGGTLGATGQTLPTVPEFAIAPKSSSEERVKLAVVGAHLSGEPLNYQLIELGGVLVRACRTSPIYKLYALTGTAIPKPGLVRQSEGGSAIEVEVWELSIAAFGRFVALIPPPLGIGTLVLEDGSTVQGFLCESYAVAGAIDISDLGGWRAYNSRF
ncbi:allophanate hydrolase [Microcoleus sp. A006_D1]|uniref:allophanate hydrolase n=1 Tax=Microcoleus sp. A006_D1 TaxID=3055267 RepID=UPI002FD6B360